MKKKIISLIVSIVMVITMLPTYAIPALAEEPTCDHILTQEAVDKIPDAFWETHSKLDYEAGDPAFINAEQPAGCQYSGWTLTATETTGFCIMCGQFITEDDKVEIPAIGHSYDGDVVSAATCTKPEVRKCSHDNFIVTAKLDEATGLYRPDTKTYSCDAQQVMDYVLEKTGEENQPTGEVGEPLGHLDGEEVKENFVNLKLDSGVPVEDGEGNYITDPCDQDGSYDVVVYCVRENCDGEPTPYEISRTTVPVPATGHDFTRTDAVAATCITAGNIAYDTCSICGKLFDEEGKEVTQEETVIPALGHDLSDWTVVTPEVPATCTTDGTSAVEEKTCSRCDYKETRGGEVIDALGHVYEKTEEVVADCEVEDPHATYTCSRCGHSYRTEYEAFSHDWHIAEGDGHYLAPKCEEPGYQDYVCNNPLSDTIPHTKREVLPPPGHTPGETVIENYVNIKLDDNGDPVFEDGKYVTSPCDEAGSYDEVVYCTVCGEELSRKTVPVPASEHILYIETQVYPTCTEGGRNAWCCERCGQILFLEPSNPLGHQWELVENADCVHGDVFRCTRHHIDTATGVPVSTTTSTEGATDPDYKYPVLMSRDWEQTGRFPWQGHYNYTYEYECGEITEYPESINYNLTFKENSGLVKREDGQPKDFRATNTNPYYTTKDGNRPENDYDYEIPVDEIKALDENADISVYVATGDDFSLEAIDYGTDVKEQTATIDGRTFTYTANVKRTGHTYTMEYVPARCEFDAYYIVTCNRKETVPYLNEERACAYPNADTAKNEIFIVVFPNTAFGHNWSLRDDASNVDPHCTTDGTRHWVCLNDRNHIYTEKLPATGHNWVLVENGSVPATCGTDGYDLYVCQNKADDNDLDSNHGDICGAEKKVFTEAATGNHTFEVSHVEATCTNDGYDLYTCTVCGYSYQITTSDAKKHQFVVVDHKDATCTTEGYSTYKCLYCDVQYDSDFVSKKDHSFVADVVAPTCSREGFTTFTCEVCGAKRRNADGSVYFTNITRPVDHVLNYVYTVAPTCGEDGKKVSRCVNCMYVQEEVIPATGNHQYDETVTKDPTCAELGEMTFECSVCGYSYTEELPKTDDHLYNERITRNPTCHRVGEMTYTCSICGNSYTEQLPKTDDHVYFEYVITNPTCSHEGELGYICYICGNIYTEELPKTDDHTYDEVITIEPTCVDKGEMTYTCSACGYIYTEELPTTGDHQYDEEITVEPTCADKGEMTFTCSVCGFSYTEELPTTGDHQYDEVLTVAPTCKDKGLMTYTCSVCGFSYTEDVDVTGDHQYDEVLTVAPTCKDKGLMTYTCKVCGFSYTEDVPVTGDHQYNAVVTVQPTCSKTGVMTYTCKVCGFNYTEELPKTDDHKYADSIATVATCGADGVMLHKCSDCGFEYTTVIPATGDHRYNAEVKPSASCVDKGLVTYTCACGYSYTEEIPATDNHIFYDNKDSEDYCAATCAKDGVMPHTCKICGYEYTTVIPATGAHEYEAVVTKEATCVDAGLATLTCKVCGDIKTEEIPVNGVHHVFTDVYTGATCVDRAFYTRTCAVCGLVVKDQTNDAFIGHQYVKTIVPASINKAGKEVFTCSVCGDTYSEPIAAIKTVKLSQTKFTYTGKEIKPIAQVYDANGKRITTNYYTVKYKSNKKIGTASVVITFKGHYTGTVTKTFKIIPRNVGTSEVTSPKKGVIKYTWGRVANCDGYQVQYSTSKDFASKKTVTIKNKKTCTKELKSLKSGKKYYIRARAFKLVDGKKVYGNWSTTSKKCK